MQINLIFYITLSVTNETGLESLLCVYYQMYLNQRKLDVMLICNMYKPKRIGWNVNM